jgi:hypothetical protein
MLVVVSASLGLGGLLPNVAGDMDWQMTLDLLKNPHRNFGIHHAKLGFNPFKRMLWVGTTSMSEDVWIAMAPRRDDSRMLEDLELTHGGRTCLSERHRKILLLFLAYVLCKIPMEDIYLREKYPDLEKNGDFENASNVL